MSSQRNSTTVAVQQGHTATINGLGICVDVANILSDGSADLDD
jgi:hypothetical protein